MKGDTQKMLGRKMSFETSESRRSFLRGSLMLGIGTVGAALASDEMANAIKSCSPAPVPIPGGFNGRAVLGPRYPDRLFHLFLPGPTAEPSTIFNFQGTVGILNIHGTGTRTELDPITGAPLSRTHDLPFATDVRFMLGSYIGVDGETHKGTFAFF
jgi:hypothetical protein